jgi:drug/metabolite transporter (DMT)-like permease
MHHLGEIAALATSVCWTCSSLAFEAAGRRIGALSLNLVRMGIALVLLAAVATAWRGLPLPTDVHGPAWAWLSASGIVGFVIGDLCLFSALTRLGVRISMLIQSLAPALTALLGWACLGETPSAGAALGIALTVAGVVWATAARTGRREAARTVTVVGLLLAFLGAFGQAAGMVLSKHGMALPGEARVDALAATQVRALAGTLGFVLVMQASGWWGRFSGALRDTRALGLASVGAFFGPCLGVTLSLFAVSRTQAGIASSLMALPPVLLLPVVAMRGERVGMAGVLGALAAVAGVVVLVA